MKSVHSLLRRCAARPARCIIVSIVGLFSFFLPSLYIYNVVPNNNSSSSSSSNGGQQVVYVVELQPLKLLLEKTTTFSTPGRIDEKFTASPPPLGEISMAAAINRSSDHHHHRSRTTTKFTEMRRKHPIHKKRHPPIDSIIRANNDTLPQESYFAKKNNLGVESALVSSETLCEKADAANCIGKFQQGLTSSYRVVQNYQLLGCLIRKNMSAMMRAILCYLTDEEKFQTIGATLSSLEHERKESSDDSDERKNRLCEIPRSEGFDLSSSLPVRFYPTPKTEPTSILTKQRGKEDREGGWNLMAIVREPIDRFLSGFIYMCIFHEKGRDLKRCNGCGYNLTCFIITEYQRMKGFEGSFNSTEHHLKEDEGKLSGVEDTEEDRHLMPQNWRCDFKNLLSRYTLLHYSAPEWRLGGGKKEILAPSAFPARLAAYLGEKLGVGAKSLRYIREQLSTSIKHVTHDTEARRFLEQRLRGSPFLMEFLVRMFYWDFRLLGFPLPTLNWGRGGL